MWLWRCIDSVHVFVYDQRQVMKSLVSGKTGCIRVERDVSDLEAQLLENIAPEIVKKLKEKQNSYKYVVIAPIGVLWDRKAKVAFSIGISLGVALYKRRPKFLKEEKVTDYDPANYVPLKHAEKTTF